MASPLLQFKLALRPFPLSFFAAIDEIGIGLVPILLEKPVFA